MSSRWPWPRTRRCGRSRSSWPHLGGITNGLAACCTNTWGRSLRAWPPVGTVDETSCRKWGDQTPGVQRQYLGCEGKIENGIVTVHLGVARGPFQAVLDADLYLPRSWNADRDRCRDAGIPDHVRSRAKWKLALDQYLRVHEAGLRFDWLVFDEGYGSKGPFLWVLGRLGQRFVGEVPVNFMVRRAAAGPPARADEYQPATRSQNWARSRLARKTVADQVWRATSTRVWVARGWHVLVTAINERTGEVKYLVSNAGDEPLERVLRAASRRATIEHAFRLAKQEAGLMHYEGRSYTGLIRHLVLALIVLGFVAEHTERLRGEKPGGDSGAGVPGVEDPVCGPLTPPSRHARTRAHQRGHSISPGAKPAGANLTQETAA